MPLKQQDIIYTYESIKSLEDISSNSILSMLSDIRMSIGEKDHSFRNINLPKVLEVVESGKYKINGNIPVDIDLSSAKGVIEVYRKYSEGGCHSCVNLGRETINAQDASSGWYCEISDPSYNKDAIGDVVRVSYSGFSPKVRKYYDNPCDLTLWKPKFSPTLEKLLDQKNWIREA